MDYDILREFEKAYEKHGDKIILDNYSLKDGLYVRVKKDDTLEGYRFKNNKNEKVKEYCFKDMNGNIKSSMYNWFKVRDYYSCYLRSNKAFGDRKIHNVNYLSLFVKLDSFVNSDPKKQLDDDAIEKQWNNYKSYKKFKKKKEQEIIKTFREQLEERERLEDIEKKFFQINKHLPDIIETAQRIGVKNKSYVKIFFDEKLEKYKKESEFYYSIKIFNRIKHAEKSGDKVWGPSDSNMGLNRKKPFLESQTKENPIPFLITDKNALMLKRFFDWLNTQDYKTIFPLGDKSKLFIHRHSKNGEAIVDDFDVVSSSQEKLPNSIYFRNHLHVRKNNILVDDTTIDLLWELENAVDEYMYNHQLKNNYFGDVYSKLSQSFQTLIYLTRESMLLYFKKHEETPFYHTVKKYGMDFVLEHLRKNRWLQAGMSMNLVLSLLLYRGEEIMDIQTVREQIIKRLEFSDYSALDTEEFFFLSGQLAYYLLSQSGKHDKKGDMLEPFLRAKDAQKLKNEIDAYYFKYKHKISLNYIKFNNALSLVMAYDGTERLNKKMDSFLAGALSQNIFYMKSQKEED